MNTRSLAALAAGLASVVMGHSNAAQPGEKLWEFPTGGSVQSSPAIAPDGTVYVGSNDGKVYALTGTLGQKVWEFQTGGAVMASPAVGEDGTVYVGSQDGKMYALNGGTGQKIWEFQTSSNFVSAAAIGADGTVYVGSNDRKLYALNGSTGQKAWEFETGGEVKSSPAIGLDGTVYVGSSDLRLYALDAASGQVKWEFTAAAAIGSPAIGADGTVYVVSSDSVLHALNGVTGQRRWELAGAGPKLAIGAEGVVYLGAAPTGFWALDAKTGQRLWETMGLEMTPQGSTSVAFESAPAVGADGMVYASGLATVCAFGGPFPWPACGSFSVVHALDGKTGQAAWGGPLAPNVSASPSSSPNIGLDRGCREHCGAHLGGGNANLRGGSLRLSVGEWRADNDYAFYCFTRAKFSTTGAGWITSEIELTADGAAMATPKRALLDYLYLRPARSHLFRALPTLELPAKLNVQSARQMIQRIPSIRGAGWRPVRSIKCRPWHQAHMLNVGMLHDVNLNQPGLPARRQPTGQYRRVAIRAPMTLAPTTD